MTSIEQPAAPAAIPSGPAPAPPRWRPPELASVLTAQLQAALDHRIILEQGTGRAPGRGRAATDLTQRTLDAPESGTYIFEVAPDPGDRPRWSLEVGMSAVEPPLDPMTRAGEVGCPALSVSGSLAALDGAPTPIAFFDTGLVCRWANDAFARLTPGRRPPVGVTFAACLPAYRGDLAAVRALFDGSAEPFMIELMSGRLADAVDPAGDACPAHWTAHVFPVRDGRGAVAQVGVVAVDTTDQKRREGELTHRASHDHLTGLPNRAEMYERLAAAQARTTRKPATLALVMIDLDDFKAVNDRFGHLCGDRVIATMADRLRGVVRDGDTVARLGGDEFAMLCEDLADAGTIGATAERARTALAAPMELDGGTVVVTASVGVALAVPGDTPESLVGRADRAMYAAKNRRGAERAAPPVNTPHARSAQAGWSRD